MLEIIQGAYNGLKAAGDLAQGFIALKTEAEKNTAIIGIQRHVLDGQRALMEADALHSADLRRIGELEQHIAGMENWDRDKERYQLKAIDSGAFAYMHKPGMEAGEPAMWLCQTCFEKRHKSPLQFRGQISNVGAGRGSYSKWGCNLCKSEITVYYARKPSIPWEPKVGE